MSTPLLPLPLPGFVVAHVSTAPPPLLIDARTSTSKSSCPDGHIPSARVPSRETRRLRDLPVVAHPVRLRVHGRRFRCTTPPCPRRTLAERLPTLAPVRAQRPGRCTETVRVLGGEAGGEAGARMATRLRMPLRGDTVLRMLRRPPAPAPPPPRVLGIEAFALRKGRVSGTILVAREQHRPVDLLPERTADTVAPWLRDHPGGEVLARDRARPAAPQRGRRGPPRAPIAVMYSGTSPRC